MKIEVTKAKSLLKKELEWMRRQPRARGTKAKYRIEAFYEIQDKASQNLKKDSLELNIQEARQGGKILELHSVSKSYDGKLLIDNFSYVFKKKDRIGVVGKNGVGQVPPLHDDRPLLPQVPADMHRGLSQVRPDR